METSWHIDQIAQRGQHQAAASTDFSRQFPPASRPHLGLQRTASSSLSPNQQDLLLAALQSQAEHRQPTSAPASDKPRDSSHPSSAMNDIDLFMSPQQAELEHFAADNTPDLDYPEGDSFDFDNVDLGGEMIGAVPGNGAQANGKGDMHEKRKSRADNDAIEGGESKRQETEESEKAAKKPGRKPLTTEPTTKRKAQNRAAQRAFRERKEKHLKDLETQVSELSKAHEADKHENGLLRAKIERMSIELREYRKRLSLNNGVGGLRGSPPLNAYTGSVPARSSSGPAYGPNNFQFDFPKFGALPGSQIFGNQQGYGNEMNTGILHRQSVTPPTSQSPTTTGGINSLSYSAPQQQRSNSTGAHSTPPMATPSNNIPFGDLFSPNLLKSAGVDATNYFSTDTHQSNSSHSQRSFDATNGGESTAGLNRVFQFNSNSSTADSASPSASSSSQWNATAANSSCGTSPEPSHNSPANKNDKSFPQPSKLSNHQSIGDTTVGLSGNSFDFSVPSANTFDPLLFGDYRDVTGPDFGNSTDFGAGSFFDDALNSGPFDLASPSNLFGILQSPQQTHTALPTNSGAANGPTPSKNLMAEIDRTRDGGDDDYGLPNTTAPTAPAPKSAPQPAQMPPKKKDNSGKMISCNNIWNQLQSNPDFQAGTFDLDSLCSELRAKARCSESGVMVNQDHVDAALKKLAKKDDKGNLTVNPTLTDVPPLMFEQESWDNVLKKLGGGGGRM
ncbi:hypothetical protein M433DRAFT_62767 [Acidomyces richmondensis BFW]|nr:MAG: hypothetical protein FE78DRAFT_140910 [Acidomyces sp. 'richmondensis']KYG47582.1 hypothetical protein M433DRAFT_62767 [Acidomyces richmondensis BFW]